MEGFVWLLRIDTHEEEAVMRVPLAELYRYSDLSTLSTPPSWNGRYVN